MSLKYKCPECGTPLGFEGLYRIGNIESVQSVEKR